MGRPGGQGQVYVDFERPRLWGGGGGVCPQTAKSVGVWPAIESYLEMSATEQEDCLNLNVYTPSLKGQRQTLLPVLMYIHGGAGGAF